MFCKNCTGMVKKGWRFCPHCGYFVKGGNPVMREIESQFRVFNKILGKGLQDVEFLNMPMGKGIKISINSKPVQKIKEKRKFRWFKRPKEIVEAKTSVKRTLDGLKYEIEVPGVKSVDNVEINELNNSVEVKAFSKDKAYSKVIPVGFKIQDYYLDNGKLILQLKE